MVLVAFLVFGAGLRNPFIRTSVRHHEYTAIMVVETGMNTPDIGGWCGLVFPLFRNATRSRN